MRPGRMGITLLGRLGVDRHGSPVRAALPGRRSELVFAYLAAEHRRIVSRDELADALWPAVLPDTWAAALRGVVSEVRRFLEAAGLDAGEMLVSASGGYQLRLPDGIAVDLDESRAALAAAREQLSEGEAVAAGEHAERAAELARLPFLPYHDGTWVEGIRKELEEIHVAALELQVRARRQAGDVRSAAAAADRLVRADPFSESAHRRRIELLAETGDRAGAVRAYEQCRAVLGSELGLEPSAETQSVLQRALAAPAAEVIADDGELGAHSVLVVEDHDFQRRTAAGVLRRLGVGTVLEASDGEAALELLADSPPPDVIVVDVDMPGMDGVELLRRVSERRLASAVVIASGLDRRLVQAVHAVGEGYGLEVLGAVEKPLTVRNMSALLARYRRPSAPDDVDHGLSLPDPRRVVAHLQPIVDLGTGQLAFAEAVPRPAIESRGLDQHMLGLVCDLDLPIDVALRIADGPADAQLADGLIEIVGANGGDPRRIVLVLDDRVLRAGASAALEAVTRLRANGFGVWLDGFEGGSATLDRFPLTGLRLAPRLVSGARVAPLQQALDAALALDLPVVGAGCGSAAEFELLLQLGCGYAQGAFVAAAMTPRELASWTPPVVGA